MFRSLRVQLGAIFIGFVLLGWSYLIVRRRIVQPLTRQGEAVQGMAAGHLDRAVAFEGDDALAQAARAFEALRAEIAAAHDPLESRVAQRTRELISAFEFSQEIIAQLDLRHLLRSVADRARALSRAEAVSLCLLDESGAELTLAVHDGNGVIPVNLRQSVPLAPAAQEGGQGEIPLVEAACATCGFLRAHAPGLCVAVPVRVGERVLGALCVVRSGGPPFDPDETRALTLLANSAAIAIVNARLIEAGRQQAEQAAALAERERLAAELHDHLAQTLGFLNLKIDRVKEIVAADRAAQAEAELERMKSIVGETYAQVRAALIGLRELPPAADDLAEKLSTCLADFREASGLPADLVIADPSALALSSVAQAQALLIVREALTNVRRHAQARQARVRVERANGEAVFTVDDDGRGFDPHADTGEGHLGLAIMRTRAERIGGRLTIDSAPGAGTRVVARFALSTSQTQ